MCSESCRAPTNRSSRRGHPERTELVRNDSADGEAAFQPASTQNTSGMHGRDGGMLVGLMQAPYVICSGGFISLVRNGVKSGRNRNGNGTRMGHKAQRRGGCGPGGVPDGQSQRASLLNLASLPPPPLAIKGCPPVSRVLCVVFVQQLYARTSLSLELTRPESCRIRPLWYRHQTTAPHPFPSFKTPNPVFAPGGRLTKLCPFRTRLDLLGPHGGRDIPSCIFIPLSHFSAASISHR
jgi:hypothetical protein